MEAPAESTLQRCVHDSLSLHLYDNARFMSERLAASYPSEVRPAALGRARCAAAAARPERAR